MVAAMRRGVVTTVLACVTAALLANGQHAGDDRGPGIRVTVPADTTVLVTLRYANSPGPQRVAAVSVVVDDETSTHELLVFPTAAARDYQTVIGPLRSGTHTIRVAPSRFWPSAVSAIESVAARIVSRADPDAALLRFAPALWARADTIGSSSDLPLVMYAESRASGPDATTLTYSVIFSNEDGGTPARALMARWGRLTDIEWVYTVRVKDGVAVDETFQSVNHDTRTFAGRHLGTHPMLTVATLNNVFSDRGESGVLFRPAPRRVDLTGATRESVMDLEPWTYRVMIDEARDEGRIAPAGSRLDLALVRDLSSYVYLEARLTLRGTSVTAYVQDASGVWHASDEGVRELAVARDGWVRIAVPGGPDVRGVAWGCTPLADPADSDRREAPSCRIEAVRAFRLEDRLVPGPNLIEPRVLQLEPGELESIPMR